MDEVRVYVVEAYFADGWWVISVPGVPGAFSQARSFVEVEPRAREAIALMLSGDGVVVGVDDFGVDVVCSEEG